MDGRRRNGVMLRGHESLLRLVGKRRKLQPSDSSSPDSDDNLDGVSNDGIPSMRVSPATGGQGSRMTEEASGNENCSLDWVSCPVCLKSMRGNDLVMNNHLDICLVKGSRRKSTQLTLFSSMGRTLKSPTLDFSKEKAGIGNGTSVVQKSAGNLLSSPPHLLDTKGSISSCLDVDDDFQENEHTVIKFDPRHTNTDSDRIQGSLDGDNIVVGSSRLKKEVSCGVGNCSNHVRDMGISPRNEGILWSQSTEYVEEKDIMKDQIVRPKVLERRNSSLQVPDGVGASKSLGGMKVEPFQLTDANLVKFKEVCICTCHFALASSWCSDTSRLKADASLREKSAGVNDGEASSHIDDIQRLAQTDLPFVVGNIDTHIVGRKHRMEADCDKGMQLGFLRDPDNPKDASAIKVLTPDRLLLGYLRRQVAQHLSQLLDEDSGILEGFVVAVPEDVFEAIPIKVVFKMKNVESVHEETITKLWQQVVSASLTPFRDFKYEANFLCLLRTVLERDSHLFIEDEQAFLSSFHSLSGDAQRLFVHLYQRKGPWFRISSLNYSDVANVEIASQELVDARYMVTSNSLADASDSEVKELVEVLSVSELRQLVSSAQLRNKREVAGARREELVNWAISGALAKNQVSALGSCSGTVVKEMVLGTSGACVRVSDDALFLLWRLQRLFFLNGDQELSSFLLVDLGMVKYPQYQCRRTTPVFATREALLEYEKGLAVAQGVDMALEVNDVPTVMALLARARTFLSTNEGSKQPSGSNGPSFHGRFTAARVYATVCTLGVSILEREHRYVEAVNLLKELLSTRLQSGRRGYWTVRLSIDLDHLGRKEESLQVAEKGVTDPLIRGGDRVALQRRVVRLSKPPRRWRKPPYAEALELKFEEVQIKGRPLNCTTGIKSRFYGYDGQQCGVEELALQYYASEEGGGWEGMHSEGGVWMTLFGLLMWEILFADVADVFQTQFQTAPLDLGTQSFYTARQSIIEARLQEICEGSAIQLLAEAWSKYHGTYCRGVNWDKYPLETLQTIAACVGGAGLSAVCRLLSEDNAGYSAGMPDLLLWRTYKKPSLFRRSSSNMDCQICHCGQEVTDLLELSHSAEVVETVDPVKVEGCVVQGEAKLVEVKGPRDRLSEQQRAWIAILLNAGLSVQVCKVLENLEC